MTGARQQINVVWLKRDLRICDHEPLARAEAAALPYLILFCFEPDLISAPDTSLRHLQFQFHSLLSMQRELSDTGHRVHICYGNILDVFGRVQEHFQIQQIFSYQESGTARTWNRDKAVATWCEARQITWVESQRDGIVRGLRNRDGWDKAWYKTMHSPQIANHFSAELAVQVDLGTDLAIPSEVEEAWSNYPLDFQPAGTHFGLKYLESWLTGRGVGYAKQLSKPFQSRLSCTRLSPYLAWGNLSLKQVYQAVYHSPFKMKHKFAAQNLLDRLRWHCHFIQKFEMECSYETKCINRGYEALQQKPNQAWITAWETGNTGYPLVDACMRCLHATGWINFRMRAMLVSFFCHVLYQDWRMGTYHLARLFLDYEPGIHYPQFQMQAGTTGINIVRMYNPIKQSEEHDPDGVFIKKWVPELAPVAKEFIHEPWKRTTLEQELDGCVIGRHYPAPIVDLETQRRVAREQIWALRKTEAVKTENQRILKKHTRRSV